MALASLSNVLSLPVSYIPISLSPSLSIAHSCAQEHCTRFGVRALPKRKMVNKLEEIYNYTHPLVGKSVGACLCLFVVNFVLVFVLLIVVVVGSAA